MLCPLDEVLRLFHTLPRPDSSKNRVSESPLGHTTNARAMPRYVDSAVSSTDGGEDDLSDDDMRTDSVPIAGIINDWRWRFSNSSLCRRKGALLYFPGNAHAVQRWLIILPLPLHMLLPRRDC